MIGLRDDALLNEISGPYKKRSLAQRAGSVLADKAEGLIGSLEFMR